MPARPVRSAGWAIAAACLIAFVASAAVMARRAGEFNRAQSFPHFRFDVTNSRAFKVFDRAVQLTDEPGEREGNLRIQYGDLVRDVPVKKPPALNLPDLGGYQEWLKVIEVHEVERAPATDGKATIAQDKPGSARLVLVVRRPAAGFDPETWGTARVDDWTFDFHEFQPDGTIETSTFRWPRSDHGEEKLRKQVESGDQFARDLAAIPPLPERTWEYQAALHAMPKLSVPKYRFQNDAFTPRVMGWTLPVGMLSVLGMLVGLGMALGGRRGKEPLNSGA
jgi:hypothetical protein